MSILKNIPREIVERDASQLIIDWLLGWFDEIVITMGNHDRRLIRWADVALDIKDLWYAWLRNS